MKGLCTGNEQNMNNIEKLFAIGAIGEDHDGDVKAAELAEPLLFSNKVDAFHAAEELAKECPEMKLFVMESLCSV